MIWMTLLAGASNKIPDLICVKIFEKSHLGCLSWLRDPLNKNSKVNGMPVWTLRSPKDWDQLSMGQLHHCQSYMMCHLQRNCHSDGLIMKHFFCSICRVWHLNWEVFMEQNMLLGAVLGRFGARLGIHFQSVETQVKSMVQSMLENGFKNAKQYAPGTMWITVPSAAGSIKISRWSVRPCSCLRSDRSSWWLGAKEHPDLPSEMVRLGRSNDFLSLRVAKKASRWLGKFQHSVLKVYGCWGSKRSQITYWYQVPIFLVFDWVDFGLDVSLGQDFSKASQPTMHVSARAPDCWLTC